MIPAELLFILDFILEHLYEITTGILLVTVFLIWISLPPEAKKLWKAKRSRKPLSVFINFMDNGIAKIELGKPHSLGFAEISGKFWKTFVFMPRRRSQVDLEATQETRAVFRPAEKCHKCDSTNLESLSNQRVGCKDCDIITNPVEHRIPVESKTVNEEGLQMYEDEITKRWYLEGVKKPVYAMYSGMSQTVSPSTLASLEINLDQLPKHKQVKRYFATLLDVRKLKDILSQSFTLDQVNYLEQLCIEMGKKLAEKGETRTIIFIAVLAAAFAFLAGAMFGPMLGL